MEAPQTLHCNKPCDMHVHFREISQLANIVPWTARCFSHALVMPNLQQPLTLDDPKRIEDYRKAICQVAEQSACGYFKPHMTFKILPNTSASQIHAVRYAPAYDIAAGKLYPKGLTTNAEDGVDNFFALMPVFKAMARENLVLCIHGEMPGDKLVSMEREKEFLLTLKLIAKSVPDLRIVMEHITTEAAVEAVLSLTDNVAATITVHHLMLTHNDVAGDKWNPHNFCKPIAKLERDRQVLRQAATSGCPKFFFGSDSAPHPTTKKESSCGCAGCFTAPLALPLLAEIFDQENALDRFSSFVDWNARNFYRLPPIDSDCGSTNKLPPEVVLVKEPITFKEQFEYTPFWMDRQISWRIVTGGLHA